MIFPGNPGAGPLGYTYLGCYTDWGGRYGGRTFPDLLDGGRYVSVDECAAAARDKGYQVFALEWYGECFLGSFADVAAMDAALLKKADDGCQSIPCAAGGPCPGWTLKVFFFGGVPPSLKAQHHLDREGRCLMRVCGPGEDVGMDHGFSSPVMAWSSSR